MDGINSGGKRRKMCVAGGCSRRKSDGVSLHKFPFDLPGILPTVDGLRVQPEEKLKRSNPSICALFCAFYGGFLPSQISLDGVGESSCQTERV